ncbi:MAG: CapA family protein [Thermodesulfobacteriota bacterium]
MVFESEKGNISIAACADCLLSRPLSSYQEPGFLRMVEILRGADASFLNLEQVIAKDEGWPDESKKGMPFAGNPRVLADLKWVGINLVSCANNHSYDYGIEGVLSTIRYLDEAGLAHAGTGRTLGESRAPGYLDTAAGRVALVAMATSTITAGRAGEQRPDFRGRPGLNTLRTRLVSTVDQKTFDQVRQISDTTGYELIKENERKFFPHMIPQDNERQFYYLNHRFVLSDRDWGTRYEVDERDKEAILRSVGDARKQADWVLVSVHWHDHEGKTEEPPSFLKDFARNCIDHGADAFLGHGPHELCGIEVHKGRPIFYSLANFACQLETVDFLPFEAYEELGLTQDDRPSAVYDARTRNDSVGWVAHREFWEGVFATVHFEGWRLKNVRLYPLDFGFKGPRTQRGRPIIPDESVGNRILKYLAKLSAPFGTKIKIEKGIGLIEFE